MARNPRSAGQRSKGGPAGPAAPEALEDLRRRLCGAVLSKAGAQGWGAPAMRAAARTLGIADHRVKRAFPRGVPDLLLFYCADGDRRMTEALDLRDLDALRVPEKIALAVRTRLDVVADEKEAVKRATAHLSLPVNAACAARALFGTVDAMWKAAGDSSQGTAFCTRRLTLAGVYSPTLLVWLGDKSPGHADTWRFLDGRLADVAAFGRVSSSVRGLADRLPELFGQWRPGRRT